MVKETLDLSPPVVSVRALLTFNGSANYRQWCWRLRIGGGSTCLENN